MRKATSSEDRKARFRIQNQGFATSMLRRGDGARPSSAWAATDQEAQLDWLSETERVMSRWATALATSLKPAYPSRPLPPLRLPLPSLIPCQQAVILWFAIEASMYASVAGLTTSVGSRATS